MLLFTAYTVRYVSQQHRGLLSSLDQAPGATMKTKQDEYVLSIGFPRIERAVMI